MIENFFQKSWVYYFILLTAICSLVLFTGGFIWGVQNVLSTNTSDLPTLPIESVEQDGKLNLVTLGDSLTRGIGDSKGVGYVGLLRESLSNEGENDIQLANLSVSGATSSDLLSQLSSKGVLHALSQADLIIMTIGGNDLFRGAGDLQEIDLKQIEDVQKRFHSNLRQIFNELRKNNNNAPIYLIGIYNAFGDLEQSEETTKIVTDWNYQTQLLSLSYKNVIFVPVADIFQGNLQSLLYSDHFHPNDEGYKLISNRLFDLIDLSNMPSLENEVD
jgi:lysophospholipase L1-like esterase